MSYLKINPDLFIGSQELNRFKEFLDDRGFRKLLLQDSLSFGILNTSKAGNFTNFRIEQGTNAGTIKNADGLAIDKFGNLITRLATDNIALTDNNQWYWIKIKHQHSTQEAGTVTIDVNGNMVGVGTEFLKVLRGNPNNPVRVKFANGVSNTGEYLITEVIDDLNAVLAGDFLAESGLKLVVVGAFTPDTVTPGGSKDIYQYDSCLMTLVLEAVSNTPPTLLADEEFVIARVRRNGSTVSIEDKRNAIYKTKADYSLTRLPAATNPLIGIEAIKWASNQTPRDKNIVYLSWSFRSTNWTVDTAANRLTIIAGQGGKFKDTTYFTNGDFDGWRVYAKNSDTHSGYAIVKQSTKSGSQINLVLESLDPNTFTDTAQEVVIVPDADSIDILFLPHPADAIELTSQNFFAKINEGFVRIPVVVFKPTSCTYNVQYRLSTFGDYRKPTPIPSDPVGYLIESDFDINGVQTASVRQVYTTHATNGFITLVQASNAYVNRIGSIETGDLFGTEHLIPNNAGPVVDYTVGLKKQYQIVETKAIIDGGLGTPYTLTVDHYINLKKTGVTGLKGGNAFIFQFKASLVLGGFNFKFTQDYVNSGSPGTILYTITATDIAESGLDNLLFRCVYDSVDAKWIVYRMVHDRGQGIPSARTITAGAGLIGGGDLSADRTLNVNPDDSTIEVASDVLRVKDAGITNAKLAAASVSSDKATDSMAVNGTIETDDDMSAFMPPGLQIISGSSPAAPESGAGTWVIITSSDFQTINGYKSQLAIKIITSSGNPVGTILHRSKSSGGSSYTSWTVINDPAA